MMAEENMPATEAAQGEEDVSTSDVVETDESLHYELAFHVLPTVAEEEVTRVFEESKKAVTEAGGVVTSEESPQRFNLAYTITKRIDDANQRFATSYFGWIRFRMEPAALSSVSEWMDTHPNVLRYMVIKLTKDEEATPHRVFGVRPTPLSEGREGELLESKTEKESGGEVSEEALGESLEKIVS